MGTGAFGQVFACYDEELGRELAVKSVHVDKSNPEVSKVKLSHAQLTVFTVHLFALVWLGNRK